MSLATEGAKPKKNYMTPAGHEKLRAELEQLLKVERPEVVKTVAWAASLGDRSENADYIYGKKRLREIDKRAAFLTTRLDDAVIIDPKNIQSDKVQFGAEVRVEDEEGEQKTYCIVGSDETNTDKGHISWLSPIGKALMNKEVGDTAIVRAPGGERELEIISISYGEIQ